MVTELPGIVRSMVATESPADNFVTLERLESGVAIIRLDRPKMNALSIELVRQLGEVVGRLEEDLPGAVVVYGGDKIFAAGADITEFTGPEVAGTIAETFHSSLDRLAALPRATIAAISGYALGGGCELALACDLRVVSEKAKLGQPEVLLGVICGGGGTQRLPRLVGPSIAKDLLMTGRMLSAQEALAVGLANRVVPHEEVLSASLELAESLAKGALVAQALSKKAIDDGMSMSLVDGLKLEKELFVDAFSTVDAEIGVKSFLENGPGKANFIGR